MQFKHLLRSRLALLYGVVSLLVTVIIIVIVSVLIWRQSKPTEPLDVTFTGPIREQAQQYKFIKPLLMYEIGDKADFADLLPLEKQLQTKINELISNRQASKVSVYIRNIDSGHWTGVNENEQYDPASLMKVTLMIAYLKFAESRPEMLTDKLSYSGNADQLEHYQSQHDLVDGQTYTADALIKDMIVKSGNDSTKSLFDHVDKNELYRIYTDLGFQLPTSTAPEAVSPKQYASLFRILYGSTYLPRVWSEQSLSLLSRTEFTKGIVAGVPGGTVVAHKFGERTLISNDKKEVGLHDCGIVYGEKKTHLICIMTTGTNFESLEKVLKDISQLTYEFFNR
ncbi:MAG: serine hydrolase [Candidatus Buchananbacteria bacterium]|nr:serine hydrolase [Candidatus Buchananbacteria bacterium]